MISVTPIRNAKLTVLARAARVRQRVILTYNKGYGNGLKDLETRVFEPHHRKYCKNGSVTYFGFDTKIGQIRQFSIDNIIDVQIVNHRSRFSK